MKVRSAAGRCSVAGHAVDRAAAHHHRVGERLLEHDIPFALAPGHRAQSGIAGPAADEGVDAKLRQPMLVDLGLERRRRVVVRGLQLHRLEARGGGRSEPLQQGTLGEQVGKVGGETGHVIRLWVGVAFLTSLAQFRAVMRPLAGLECIRLNKSLNLHEFSLH